MQDMEGNNKKDFVIEKIKERPVSRKKLLRRTITTASMAVMFGLIACFTFLVLEPLISNWLYPKEEPQMVIFPEEQEEMEPEEMLSDNIFSEESSNTDTSDDKAASEEKQQILNVLDTYTWNIENYVQMYTALGDLAKDLKKHMVTVTASKYNTDWLANVTSSKTEASGVIVANNGKELMILTDYSNLKNADSMSVTFVDDFKVPAQLKQKHISSDIAIVTVSISAMGDKIADVSTAPLGSSNVESLLATPIIAIGEPTGVENSVCYGMITSENGEVSMVDANFEVLVTNIYGGINGTGFLFNLKGQLVGMITGKKPSTDVRNMVTAFEIGDLKRLISRLSNGYAVPYVGITGTSVSEEIHEEGNVPMGIYVKSVAMDSPAMKAGIQPGDVVVAINNKSIKQYKDYFNTIAGFESNTAITLKVMRLSVNEFKEIEFNIILGKAE